MGWFSRRKTDTDRLVESIIAGELKRRELDAIAEQKRLDFELRKIEIETENLELIAKEKRNDAGFREELRAMRREAGRKSAVARAEKKAAAANEPVACPVCRDPGSAGLTAAQIEYHHLGHRTQGGLFEQ